MKALLYIFTMEPPPQGQGGLLAKLLQVHFACLAPKCETRQFTGTQAGLLHDDEQRYPRPALAGLNRQYPCAHCPIFHAFRLRNLFRPALLSAKSMYPFTSRRLQQRPSVPSPQPHAE